MDANVLEFPKLGLKLTLHKNIIEIGDFSIAWYGVLIAVGFLLALLYGLKYAKKFGVNPDKMIDVAIGGIIGGVIGARLYYVLFQLDSFRDDWLGIFRIWEGGLAIYGGLIGAVLAGALVCKWRKVKFLPMLDIAGIGFLIGQCIGRWGNFVNIEAYGCNTTLPWGMWSEKIETDYFMDRLNIVEGVDFSPYDPVHPCFLYESLWCLLGFLVLHFIWSKRRKFDGELFLGYLAWYGAGRVVIEGLRTDSLMIPGTRLRVSQVLAGLLVVASVVLIIVIRSKIRRNGDPAYLQLYVQTEGWAEELEQREAELARYREQKARKKAGLPPLEETESDANKDGAADEITVFPEEEDVSADKDAQQTGEETEMVAETATKDITEETAEDKQEEEADGNKID